MFDGSIWLNADITAREKLPQQKKSNYFFCFPYVGDSSIFHPAEHVPVVLWHFSTLFPPWGLTPLEPPNASLY